MYKPKDPFITPFMILNPTNEKINGKVVKKYPDIGEIIEVSFKTFGGTETVVNGVLSIIDTGNIETWYRDDIKSDTWLKSVEDGQIYQVKGKPEDIERRHLFLKFKVEAIGGSSG